MPPIKLISSLGLFAAGSLAQSFTSDPSCPSSILSLYKAAPSAPPYIATILPDPASAFKYPWEYASSLCEIANEFPASQLSGFASWGQALLGYAATELPEYDALVTKCYATGAEAASATSYIHSIASQTGPLCEVTSAPSPSGMNGVSNGTATLTTAPTSTIASISFQVNSSTTPIVATGSAAKPIKMFASATSLAALLAAVALLQ
ncbi:hypothetical protein F5Y14DRAFT_441605 [Nemania sp. NC0429]|nr:hypothetical protein F5Y14DRAFT_441605 [Nemania sp. NC0429]